MDVIITTLKLVAVIGLASSVVILAFEALEKWSKRK